MQGSSKKLLPKKLPPAFSFFCRACKSNFKSQSAEEARCRCGQKITQHGLLFQFNDPAESSGYRLNDETFDRYLQSLNSLGWPRAFYQLLRSLDQDASDFYSATVSPWRSGWKWLLPFTTSSRFLCIGARQESIALGLASHGAEVILIDRCRDRLIASALAADAMKLFVTCLETKALLGLPFSQDAFDGIIIPDLQDTLQYFGTAQERCLSREQLVDLQTMLKPTGSLFIAGDNRFTYSGVSSKEREGVTRRPRRSSTSGNSYRGYSQRLRESGFIPSQVYAPLPKHRNAREFIPIGGELPSIRDSVREVSNRVKGKLAIHPHFLKAFGHSFAIVAGSSADASYSFLHEVMLRIQWQLKTPNLTLEQLRFTSRETLAYCRAKEIPLLIRIPQTSFDSAFTLANAEFLRKIHAGSCPRSLERLLPTWLHTSEQESVVSTVETRTALQRLGERSQILESDAFQSEILQVLLQLSSMRRSGAQPVLPLLTEMLDSTKDRLIDRAIRERYREVGNAILRGSREMGLPGVLVHGMFGLDVIKVSAEGTISGITDWHGGLERGLPGWDCVGLETSYLQSSYGCSFGEAILSLLEQGSPALLRSLSARYDESMQIRPQYRSYIVLTYWLLTIWRSLSQSTMPLNYPWLRRNVISVLEKAEDFIP